MASAEGARSKVLEAVWTDECPKPTTMEGGKDSCVYELGEVGKRGSAEFACGGLSAYPAAGFRLLIWHLDSPFRFWDVKDVSNCVVSIK